MTAEFNPDNADLEAVQARREALAARVIEGFQAAFAKLSEYRNEIEQLWQEFEQLGPGETIKGCRTKTEFCKNILHREIRSVQYLLKGGNVNRRETVSLSVSLLPEEERAYRDHEITIIMKIEDAELRAILYEQFRLGCQIHDEGDPNADLVCGMALLEGKMEKRVGELYNLKHYGELPDNLDRREPAWLRRKRMAIEMDEATS